MDMKTKHKEVYELLYEHPGMMRDKSLIKRDYSYMNDKLNAAYKDGCIGIDKDIRTNHGVITGKCIWWKC